MDVERKRAVYFAPDCEELTIVSINTILQDSGTSSAGGGNEGGGGDIDDEG